MCLGVPGRVVSVSDEGGLPMASVDFGGIRRDVCLAYLPDTGVGSYVIVHVGFAISEVDEAEAQRTLHMLRSMDADALAAELGEPRPEPDVAAPECAS